MTTSLPQNLAENPAKFPLPGLVCDICGTPDLLARKGVIHVSMAHVRDHERRTAEQGEPPEVAELWQLLDRMIEVGEPAPWQVHCNVCNPDRNADGSSCDDCYWFDVDRCHTYQQLLGWNNHLMRKPWVDEATNWLDFLGRFADLGA